MCGYGDEFHGSDLTLGEIKEARKYAINAPRKGAVLVSHTAFHPMLKADSDTLRSLCVTFL